MIDFKLKRAIIVTSSKDLVDWLLSLNTHNRAVKKTVIKSIADEIKRGLWQFTNQGIGITASGWLTDGQHRLYAIREAGYPPAELLIVTGLSDDAQSDVDRHAKRSSADVIRLILNRTVSNQAVAAVKVILSVKTDGDRFVMASGGRISEFDLADFMSEYHDTLSAVLQAIGSSMRAPVTAALIEYGMRHDVDAACDLAEKIRTGTELAASDPAYRLRIWLERNRGGGGMQQCYAYSAAVTACIAHARGEPLTLLRPSGSWDRLPRRKSMIDKIAA